MGNNNSTFHWEQYLSNYPDLTAAGINNSEKALNHWINHGQAEGRTYIPLKFNWEQYLLNYPDLTAAGIDNSEKALNHFVNHGIHEGRTDKLYLSIGSNCSVATMLHIIHKNIYNNKPTNLFDYLISSSYQYVVLDDLLTDVIQLSLKNINEILKDNYKFDINDLTICKDDKIINHFKKTAIPKFAHDIVFHKHLLLVHDQEIGNNDLTELNNKLNRRLERFINIIKINKTIGFIRYEMNIFDLNDYIDFKNIINRINPELNIKIYIISNLNYNPIHNLDYLKICTYNDYENKNGSNNLFLTNDFDWELFFKLN